MRGSVLVLGSGPWGHHGHRGHICARKNPGLTMVVWLDSLRPPKEIMSASALKHPAPGSVTMFSTSWCGYCNRLKAQMGREGIAFTEVNIEDVPEAVKFVMDANDGNQTVPTLLFPDGSSATNP